MASIQLSSGTLHHQRDGSGTRSSFSSWAPISGIPVIRLLDGEFRCLILFGARPTSRGRAADPTTAPPRSSGR
jgi:hypothetical protein